MELNERIRYYRKKIPMTQSELASKSGISLRALSNYENGLRTPSLEILIKISKALDVKIEDLDPNIQIWEVFDATHDINKLSKEVKKIENLDKNQLKNDKEFNEVINEPINVEYSVTPKKNDYLDNEYKEKVMETKDILFKLQNLETTAMQFNELEKYIIFKLIKIYNSIVYNKNYDINDLDEDHYNNLRQSIRNSIKKAFEEFDNK